MTSSADPPGGDRWLELSVEADAEAVEPVSEILGRVAPNGGTAVRPTRLLRDPDDELNVREDPSAPFVVTAHVPDDAAAPAAIEATERALWHLQAFGLRPVSGLSVRPVDASAWTEAWKAHYAAQRIGRVVIVPSWLEEQLRAGEVAVRMDPGMAFGTGLHPTTRGCIELLQQVRPMPPRLLDVGCGSGILALAALRLGADRADACDTDALAVAATRANAEANRLGDRVAVWQGTLPARPAAEPYQLVLANLVASVLIELAARLAAHTAPGGTLLASGIIEGRATEVRDAFAAAGLAIRTERHDGEWVSLRAERVRS
ncbi:MAG TPA: 50S ribosomal protein L11 methyltransferase [Candidatus Limnocylindria bacterium]|nr:50S ribosomal protein L11 methyltransferase [Candidatus Limnocylindria bacterium]